MVLNPIHGYSWPSHCRVGLRLLPHSLPTERETARPLLPKGIPLLHVLLRHHAIPAILDSQSHLLEDREGQVPLNRVCGLRSLNSNVYINLIFILFN